MTTKAKALSIWKNMMQRCHNPNNPDFPSYGGRGITCCERWRNFNNFYLDMGTPPEGKTLDRRDNNAGYSPENCRWATGFQQSLNTRLYCTNTSGIQGVTFKKRDKVWVARYSNQTKEQRLYYGRDFFEACCARKSWEASIKHILDA